MPGARAWRSISRSRWPSRRPPCQGVAVPAPQAPRRARKADARGGRRQRHPLLLARHEGLRAAAARGAPRGDRRSPLTGFPGRLRFGYPTRSWHMDTKTHTSETTSGLPTRRTFLHHAAVAAGAAGAFTILPTASSPASESSRPATNSISAPSASAAWAGPTSAGARRRTSSRCATWTRSSRPRHSPSTRRPAVQATSARCSRRRRTSTR